ncbi:MAG: hypothetical protein ACRD5H_05110 [Nitrososphaerales archaeon]
MNEALDKLRLIVDKKWLDHVELYKQGDQGGKALTPSQTHLIIASELMNISAEIQKLQWNEQDRVKEE